MYAALILPFRQRYVNGGYAIRIDIWGVDDVTRFFSIDLNFFLPHFNEFKQLLLGDTDGDHIHIIMVTYLLDFVLKPTPPVVEIAQNLTKYWIVQVFGAP